MPGVTLPVELRFVVGGRFWRLNHEHPIVVAAGLDLRNWKERPKVRAEGLSVSSHILPLN